MAGIRLAEGDTVVVRMPNPLGDAVAATAFLQGLKRAFPSLRLVLAGRHPGRELLAGLDFVDDFAVVPKVKNAKDLWRASRSLARQEAAAAVVLPNSWSSALEARLAGIPHRIGRPGTRRRWLLSHVLDPVGPPRPMTDFYWEFLAPFGDALIDQKPPSPTLSVTSEEKALAHRRLAQEVESEAYLAVAPGAAFGPSKVYPLDQMAEVLRILRQRLAWMPLLLGSPSEASLLRELAELLGPPVISTHRQIAGLGEMKALLRRSRLLLTMDTAARHMAAALGVPQVVLYGSTDPRWSAFQLEDTTRLWQTDLPCRPCHRPICPTEHECLAGLEPKTVVQACLQAIATE
ncbi:MAG: glycosyltransferase family 9 protein [Planctomycetota bacterium]|nr:MAG: glycosyltransferase family 9 protein [Planctomycetota bacterium]